MNPEIEENYREKLRLALFDSTQSLEKKFKSMLSLHAAKGRLASGDTVRCTIDYVIEENVALYKVVIEQLENLKIKFYPDLESEVLLLAKSIQKEFKEDAKKYLKKATEHTRRSGLYERMLPELESKMASELGKFQNRLNVVILKLKVTNSMPPLIKLGWAFEVISSLVVIYIISLWFKNPTGNYEPVVVGLGVGISLVGIMIKCASQKRT